MKNNSENDSNSDSDSENNSESESNSDSDSESESERSVRGWFKIRYEMAPKNTFRYMYLLIQLHDSLLKMQKPLICACVQTSQSLGSIPFCETNILCIFALKK